MRRVLLTGAIAAAAFVPAAPASATHCEVEYKNICVSVCLTADAVYYTVTGEHLGCA